MSLCDEVNKSSLHLFQILQQREKTLFTIESITAGRIAAELSAIPGASEVLWGGCAVYTDSAKTTLLGVNPEIISEHGAVSKTVTETLVLNALKLNPVSIALAVTGFAGVSTINHGQILFDPDNAQYPVGTVFCSCAYQTDRQLIHKTFQHQFFGSRHEIQLQAVLLAHQCVLQYL